MKKAIILLSLIFCAIFILAQEIQHEATAINIEVPVRVFKGKEFIDDLSIDDFELYENNKRQKVDALYLVKDSEIVKTNENRAYYPETSRIFVMAYILTEYLPRINETIQHLIHGVMKSGDTLILITPIRTYKMFPESISSMNKEELKDTILAILKRDIRQGHMSYESTVEFMERSLLAGDNTQYIVTEARIGSLRFINEQRIYEFAQDLRKHSGYKTVFLFYQQQTIPVPRGTFDDRLAQPSREELDILPGIEEHQLPSFYKNLFIDIKRIRKVFSDSSISFNFIYITKPRRERISITRMRPPNNLKYVDGSSDIFNAFLEMAKTTGGISDSSANINASFKKSVESSKNYYLLYYSPSDKNMNSEYREIKVKVKRGNYKVLFRRGYFANQ